MGRTKGSKNLVKEKGNPAFNINDATPVDPSWKDGGVAAGAITSEDLALDRELEMMARNTEPELSDRDPGTVVRKSVEPYTLLSEFVEDYKPAATIHELDDQVMQAKQFECDSIYATPKLIRYFTKKDYPDKVGYFVYHDIKVYIEGFFEQSSKRDKETMEQRMFGASKIS